jgi:hypothetical protein
LTAAQRCIAAARRFQTKNWGDEFERRLIENRYSHYRPIAASGEFWKQTFAAQAEN